MPFFAVVEVVDVAIREGALSTQKADGWLNVGWLRGGREGVSSTGRGCPKAESHSTHGMKFSSKGTAGSRVDQRRYSEREDVCVFDGRGVEWRGRVEVCRGELGVVSLPGSDSKVEVLRGAKEGDRGHLALL